MPTEPDEPRTGSLSFTDAERFERQIAELQRSQAAVMRALDIERERNRRIEAHARETNERLARHVPAMDAKIVMVLKGVRRLAARLGGTTEASN